MDYQNFCESYTYRHAFVSFNETSGGGFLGKWHVGGHYRDGTYFPGDGVDATVPPAWASEWAPLLDTVILKRTSGMGTTIDGNSPFATLNTAKNVWAILWPWCRLSQAGTECATGPFHRAESFTLFAVADVVDIDVDLSNEDKISNRAGGTFRATERALVADAYTAFRAAVKGQISGGWAPLGNANEHSSLANVRQDYRSSQPYDDKPSETTPVDRGSGDRNSIRLCQTMVKYDR
eukprot:COSAG06_NODE_407_length_16111_cov_3.252748_4_plen_235_part_00